MQTKRGNNMSQINIVAGGPIDLIPELSQYAADQMLWVGVDKGTVTLLDAGIIPDEAFGDFDSITDRERRKIEKAAPGLHVYQAEKDQTDLELALVWALEQHSDSADRQTEHHSNVYTGNTYN
jgi:thiamine pyrophosphokinase